MDFSADLRAWLLFIWKILLAVHFGINSALFISDYRSRAWEWDPIVHSGFHWGGVLSQNKGSRTQQEKRVKQEWGLSWRQSSGKPLGKLWGKNDTARLVAHWEKRAALAQACQSHYRTSGLSKQHLWWLTLFTAAMTSPQGIDSIRFWHFHWQLTTCE